VSRLWTATAAASTALLVSAAAHGATPRSGLFVGATSGQGKTIKYVQDRSVRFNVSSGRVRGLKVSFKATCPSGTVDSDGVAVEGSFLVRNGRFSGTKHIEDGGTGTVAGRFTTSGRASGTLRMRPIDSDEGVEGGGSERCDSGPLKWMARLR
jgi:hypothetical protein